MSNPMRVGTCIYCGATDRKLNTEHIIPFGFGNTAGDVLLEASCSTCEDITKGFEQYVLRELFGNIRKVLQLKSRRGPLPKTIMQTIRDEKGNQKEIDVPINELVDIIFLPIFDVPSASKGDYSVGDCILLEMQTLNVGIKSSMTTYTTNQVDSVKVQMEFKDKTFEKFLMKIAYCGAVKTYGYEAVKNSPIPKILLGFDRRFGTWLGCMPVTCIRTPTTKESWLQYGSYDVPNGIISAVKLFAAIKESPEYHIIIKTNL